MNPLGNNGNSPDFSQRHAPDFDDDPIEAAVIQVLRNRHPHGVILPGREKPLEVSWNDPESVEKLREHLRTPPDGSTPQAEPSDEEPQEFPGDPLSRENVEKWNQKKKIFRRKGE